MNYGSILRLCVVPLALFCLSSCAFVVVPYYPGGSTWPGQVFFDHRYKLPFGGTVDLLVEEIEAEIEIIGQKEEEVRLVASQSLPFYRRGLMIGGLSRYFPQVKVETQELALKIRIEGRKQTLFPAKISLTVPKDVNLHGINLKEGGVSIRDLSGSVRIDLGRGNLKINNFSGSIEASVMKGNIETEVLDLRANDEVRLMTEEGEITLFIEPEADAKIEAQVGDGRLTFEFPHGEPVDNYLVTTLKEGQATIILRSIKGDIKIKKLSRG